MANPMRKLIALAAVIAAAAALTACGGSDERVTTGTYAGESGKNAPYLDVGELKYQVQISRQLNPWNAEDAAYLRGVPIGQQTLLPGEEWFAVFMQVYNRGAVPHPATRLMTISDTQGNVYAPLPLDNTNEFAYRGGVVGANNRLPEQGTVAGFGPTQGALLLYRIKVVSLDNRPLTLRIVNPLNLRENAQATLDV